MPLSALDLLEMRGLPRDSSLLQAPESGTPQHSASGPGSDTSGEGAVPGESAGKQEGAVCDSTSALVFAAQAGRPQGAQPPCDAGDAGRRHARSVRELGTVGPRMKPRALNARLTSHSASFTFRNRCGSPDARPRCVRAGANAASFPGATTRRMKSWSSSTGRSANACGW
eukprot:Tamp_22622.p2 GENE.Tamp_22622~~Tamp_22622.p2  ORF type:complete len:170 (+),score=11.63 Tamp_22622:201-710(+)